MGATYSLWSWDPRNRGWIAVDYGTVKQVEAAVERRYASATSHELYGSAFVAALTAPTGPPEDLGVPIITAPTPVEVTAVRVASTLTDEADTDNARWIISERRDFTQHMFEAIDHTTKADHALVELIRLDYADLASGPVMGDLLAHLEVAGRALRAAWAVYRTETEEK